MFGLPLWILAPLTAVLLLCVIIELRTQLIVDLVTVPAAAYLLIANLVAGPKSAGAYLIAAIAIPIGFVIAGVVIPRRLGRGELIGMGAVKLLLVTSAALGGAGAFVAAGLFAALATVAVLIARQAAIPSSPLILLAVTATLLST